MEKKLYSDMDRVISTEGGLVRGVPGNTPQYTVFKGIPYAAPPVGELRWKEPQSVEPWEGIRDASKFSKIAPQRRQPAGTLYDREFFQYQEPMSEDCLYLNIWTPAVAGDEKLPVLFWVHGGALMGGYGFEPEFDGEAFCREGVILVTINYRLGVFGFFTHPELSKESVHHVSGNYGHLDQVAALKWVKRNIANFGGDPENITIFGQSAGSASVQDLLVSPLSQEDIAGIIIMSSASVAKSGFGRMSQKLADSEKMGEQYMQELGCSSIDEMRKLPFHVLDAALGAWFPPKYHFSTVIDGYFLTESPGEAYAKGNFPNIPLMVGNTMGEGGAHDIMPTVEQWETRQREILGKYGEEYLKLAKVETVEDMIRAAKKTHSGMVGDRVLCDLVLKAGHTPAYLYNFDHDLPGNEDGSFHSSELWYVFGTIQRCWRPMTGVDYDLSKAMGKYWASFAKRKDPNTEGLPPWKPYTTEDRENMLFQDRPHCEPVQENELQAIVRKVMLED